MNDTERNAVRERLEHCVMLRNVELDNLPNVQPPRFVWHMDGIMSNRDMPGIVIEGSNCYVTDDELKADVVALLDENDQLRAIVLDAAAKVVVREHPCSRHGGQMVSCRECMHTVCHQLHDSGCTAARAVEYRDAEETAG